MCCLCKCQRLSGQVKTHQNQLKTPQRHPCTMCFPSLLDGTGRVCALAIKTLWVPQQERQNCAPAGSLLSPGAWEVCVTPVPSALETLGSIPQLQLPQLCLGFPWFSSPAQGRSLPLGLGTFLSAPASPSPWMWNVVTQNYSTLQKSPARQQCLLPSHSSGACKCNDSIPWSWPVLTLVVRGLEFQNHFWCFLKS